MDKLTAPFRLAIERQDGYALAAAFSSTPPSDDPGRLNRIAQSSNHFTIQSDLRSGLKQLRIDSDEKEAWILVLVEYFKALTAQVAATQAQPAASSDSTTKPPDWVRVYRAWKDLLNLVHRGYSLSLFDSWTIPLIYTVTKTLRSFAIIADTTLATNAALHPLTPSASLEDISTTDPSAQQPQLEDCARQINRIFALVTQDRSPPPNRKYGTYAVAVLLFKTYFRLSSISLCKNVIRTVDAAAADMPPLSAFPKAHQVAYRYYSGVVAFLDERYAAAEDLLSLALNMCPAGDSGRHQAERILAYLIPTRLITKHALPGPALLDMYPRLGSLYGPLCVAVRKGDLRGFDEAMNRGEDEFVRRRVYLTLERGRDVCLRNLLRKVYLNAGYEDKALENGERARRSRLSIAEFGAGLKVAGEVVDGDEVEAMVAGMIYKNLMKGYISRAHSMVVLNKKGAFPGTGV